MERSEREFAKTGTDGVFTLAASFSRRSKTLHFFFSRKTSNSRWQTGGHARPGPDSRDAGCCSQANLHGRNFHELRAKQGRLSALKTRCHGFSCARVK